jgi:hypothetical protein
MDLIYLYWPINCSDFNFYCFSILDKYLIFNTKFSGLEKTIATSYGHLKMTGAVAAGFWSGEVRAGGWPSCRAIPQLSRSD